MADMVPVKILRGYWPRGKVEDFAFDPNGKPKLEVDTVCKLEESEASDLADKGIVAILTAKQYAAGQAAMNVPPPPPVVRPVVEPSRIR